MHAQLVRAPARACGGVLLLLAAVVHGPDEGWAACQGVWSGLVWGGHWDAVRRGVVWCGVQMRSGWEQEVKAQLEEARETSAAYKELRK